MPTGDVWDDAELWGWYAYVRGSKLLDLPAGYRNVLFQSASWTWLELLHLIHNWRNCDMMVCFAGETVHTFHHFTACLVTLLKKFMKNSGKKSHESGEKSHDSGENHRNWKLWIKFDMFFCSQVLEISQLEWVWHGSTLTRWVFGWRLGLGSHWWISVARCGLVKPWAEGWISSVVPHCPWKATLMNELSYSNWNA